MRVSIVAIVLAVVAGVCWGNQADARVYLPGVKVVQEVRTPQGVLRSYHRPGLPPTYWDQSFPALSGDRVTLDALVATGGAELGEVHFSLDGKEVVKLTRGPWRTEVDTTDLLVGKHVLEVRAKTAAPHARETGVTAALVIVPRDERAQHPLAEAGAGEPERLSSVIGSLNPELDAALDARADVVLAQPELFYASAGPEAKEFFYTLSRDKKVYYTSPLLPITTLLYLDPATPDLLPAPNKSEKGTAAEVTNQGSSDESESADSGQVILALQVGDGDGHFGPPVWSSLQVQPAKTTPGEAKP